MQPETHHRVTLLEAVIAAIVLIALVGFFYSASVFSRKESPQANSVEGLGDSLYNKSNNPIENKLPEATSVTNPLDDAYKNPFE